MLAEPASSPLQRRRAATCINCGYEHDVVRDAPRDRLGARQPRTGKVRLG